MFMVSLDDDLCTGCGVCADGCPARILSFDGSKASISGDACECMGCEGCVTVCPEGAYTVTEL